MTPPTGMSGTTGTIRHPDVSEISDLTEGLLSPSRTAEIRRHLGDCALCADVRASLEEIRSLLGTLPGPARMPADIMRPHRRGPRRGGPSRLHPAAGPGRPGRPAPHAGPRCFTWNAPSHRWEVPPARRSPDRPNRPRAAPRSPPDRRPRRSRRCRRLRPGHLPVRRLRGHARPANRRQRRGIRLRGTAVRRRGPRRLHRAGSPGQRQAAHRGRPGCQERSRGAEQHPRTGEHRPRGQAGSAFRPRLRPAGHRTVRHPARGRTRQLPGHPVYLLVLPHPADSTRVDAYLVDTACERTGSADPGKVLLTSTYPR